MADRPVRLAINGFGRIGRCILRAALEHKVPGVEFVAINDLTDAPTNAHLLQYDSVHGTYPGTVETAGSDLVVDGKKILVSAEKDPAKLPWKAHEVDVVLECTGRFTERAEAEKHLAAGAKKVIISAPAKKPDITICWGVNHEKYDPKSHRILSNASCTTNCLTPMAKIVLQKFGLARGLMTTIHSYTNDQQVLDLAHKDLRRARAAAISMIPTTTGAAKAVALVIPELEGRLDGLSIRVPTPNVSLVDLVCDTEKDVTVESVNAAMKEAADGAMKGILRYETKELVSHDFNHDTHSCVFDATLTKVQGNRLLKIMGWYDNEWGFSTRMTDLARYVGTRLGTPQ
jgi:glyceraldehyde 3-phosphate dehydrogenase